MYATLRTLQCAPQKSAEVAALIRAEYLPLISDVPGAVSYTLVEVGDDVVSSLGLFETEAAAQEANTRAQSWSAERIGPLMAGPLEARAGEVTVHEQLGG